MKVRKLELGDRNIVGKRVTEARLAQGMKQVELLAKLQLAGIDISVPALSLLEGQKRPVSDIELNALADILNVKRNIGNTWGRDMGYSLRMWRLMSFPSTASTEAMI